MDFWILILILLCIPLLANTTTFAFGSCNQFFPTHSTAIYQQIALEEPSHFVFLGDMLYIDRLVFPSVPLTWKPFTDQSEIRSRIRTFFNDSNFKTLLSVAKLQYLWDDHDYNMNNAGSDNPVKELMRKIYIEELNLTLPSKTSLSRVVDLNGRVKLVLLDGRSERGNGDDAEMIGEGTWQWLEGVFGEANETELYVIASGVQVIYDQRPSTEKWTVRSRLRLYRLLYKYRIHAVFISGDVHFAEIGRRQGIYEVTSSGLTFSAKDHFLGSEGLLRNFIPELYNTKNDRYVDINYGLIQVHHTDDGYIHTIDLLVKSLNGSTQLSRSIPFSQTIIPQLDQHDLNQTHMHVFRKYAILQVLKNPLRLLHCLPMAIVPMIGLLTLWQLRRFTID